MITVVPEIIHCRKHVREIPPCHSNQDGKLATDPVMCMFALSVSIVETSGLCIFAKMARLVAKGYAQATPRRVGIVSRESFAPVAAWEAGLKKDALPLNLRQKNGQYICCQNHKLIADIRDNDNHGTKVANRTNLTPAIQGFLLTDENLSSICLEILTLSIDISIHEIVDIE
ncbi:hypothetical protein Tco_0103096 [Tanacetum coccineum]